MCSLASFIASITVPFLALDIISLVHLWTRGMSGVDRPAHTPGPHPAGSVKSPHVVYSNPSPSIHESIHGSMIQILSLRSARVGLEVIPTGQRTCESMHCLAAVQQ